jgi:hypothetical protein
VASPVIAMKQEITVPWNQPRETAPENTPRIRDRRKFGSDTGIRLRQIEEANKTEEVLAFSST